MQANNVTLTNFYVEYEYDLSVTRLNLVVLLKETTEYMHLFAELRKVNNTIAISLANQVSI